MWDCGCMQLRTNSWWPHSRDLYNKCLSISFLSISFLLCLSMTGSPRSMIERIWCSFSVHSCLVSYVFCGMLHFTWELLFPHQVFLKAMAETGQIKLYGEHPTVTETALYRARRHVYKEERYNLYEQSCYFVLQHVIGMPSGLFWSWMFN